MEKKTVKSGGKSPKSEEFGVGLGKGLIGGGRVM